MSLVDGHAVRPPRASGLGHAALLRAARLLGASLLLAACGGNGGDAPVTPPPAGPPASVKVLTGDAQEGVVGTELPIALVVRVLDAAGRPVLGQPVSFVVTAGGGTVYAGSSVTNADGRAQERWTLGTTAAQPQTLEARAVDAQTGEKLLFATFSATAKAGPLASLTAASGNGQQATTGSALAQPLVVLARDAFGNAVPGGTVTWAVATGGGSVNPATSPIGADGQAQTSWTLGSTSGAQTATAQSSGKSLTFSATATAPPPTSLVVVSGNAQEGVVGAELPAALVVRVLDAAGHSVAGQSVSFVVTSGGGTVRAGASVTNAEGLAQERWTLGTSTSQAQTLEARTVDAQGQKLLRATFTATPKPGPAASLVLVSGNRQTGAFGSPLAEPLVVLARDSHGNAAAGATVTWTVIAGGGSFAPSSSVVAADGTAQTVWTLGNTQADQSAVARTVGVSPGVSFSASVPPASRWARMVSPTTQTLRAIWGRSASDIWAVGDAGTIVHFDGTSWTLQASGTTANLSRVWAASATEIYASNRAGAGSIIVRYDGSSWSEVAAPPAIAGRIVRSWVASPTVAISSVNQDDASYSGDSILTWDGTRWNTVLRNAGPINAVWMDTQGHAFAAAQGSDGGGAWNDGTGWKLGYGFRTFDMSGTSFNDRWIRSGTNSSSVHLVHWTGLVSDFSLTGDDLPHQPAWFVSPTEVYLFRKPATLGGEGPLVRFTGSTSSPLAGIEESIGGYAMWGASASQLFVVGAGGAIYRNTR